MKALKFIIPAVVVLIAIGVYVLIRSHHQNEIAQLRRMIYMGDTRGLDDFLSKHRSLANANNVDTEDKGWTPLHMAAIGGNKDIAELLIAKGADVNTKDDKGMTPLHWSASTRVKEVTELLLAKGADFNAKDNNGKTPLDLANKAYLGKETADLLRQHGGKE